MECNIEYVGKLRNGISQYYCTIHKSFAYDKKGNKLKECLCNYKEMYNNILDLKENNIEKIEIIYENILENVVPKIFINNKEFTGIFKYDNCILCYKDLGGLMLSKLNKIPLEGIKCSHCNHYHSDNGKFAYIPHRTHLCLYCGHLFRVKEKNIGNEFDFIYTIPFIKLNENTIKIENNCCVKYDLFKGNLIINYSEVNKILIKNEEVNVIDFLNNTLKNEF
ncbi:MAG: hypothetical protein HFJ45_01605 [Clostridia bacterium]|nr:hypothetical protein [Clostridia bacterium]